MTVHSAMASMSKRSWRWVRAMRGSGTSPLDATNLDVIALMKNHVCYETGSILLEQDKGYVVISLKLPKAISRGGHGDGCLASLKSPDD